MRSHGAHAGAPFRAAALLTLLLALVASPARSQEWSWTAGAGLGLGLDLGGSDHEGNGMGLVAHAVVIHRAWKHVGYGIQWDGAWFDGRLTPEKRLLLAGVVSVDLPWSPLVLRAGPGLGYATVVDATFPKPGRVGDALVSIGEEGSWGAVFGMAARVPLGRLALDPMAHLVWIRAGRHDVTTVVLGGRVSIGG